MFEAINERIKPPAFFLSFNPAVVGVVEVCLLRRAREKPEGVVGSNVKPVVVVVRESDESPRTLIRWWCTSSSRR